MKRITTLVGLLVSFTLVYSPAAKSQSRTASIVGTVIDSSGAVIPGARITVTNTGTGESANATTASSGTYAVLNLLYGQYKVAAEKTGFSLAVRTGLTLQIGQRVKVDFTLQIGAANQTVQVTGNAPLLGTQSSDLAQVITSRQVLDMPLVDRRWLELAALDPGAVAPRKVNAPGYQVGSAIAVNGNGPDFNNFTVDGLENNGQLVNSQGIDPTIDAIQEFRIEANSESAEYGRAATTIAVAIKSGTNQFHGSAYEFLRNDALDARSFFDKGIPPLRQNTFGGTIGGPIKRNKAFFFFDYDGLRIRQSTTTFATIPPAAWFTGDFSSVPTQLTDGYGHPLPGNQVPTASITPEAKAELAFYPKPNCVSAVSCPKGYNYVLTPAGPTNRWEINERTDLNINEKNQLFARWSEAPLNNYVPGPFAIAVGGHTNEQTDINTGFSYTHIFSPTKMNSLRGGWNYVRYGWDPDGFNQDIPGAVLPPPQSDLRFKFISFTLAGYTGIQMSRYSSNKENDYQLADTFSWIHGNHTLKFGADIRRYRLDLSTSNDYSLGFDGRWTGNPVADLLYGYAATAFSYGPNGNIPSTTHGFDTRRWDQSYFAQDDWRVTRNVTFNLGLRWDYFGPVSDKRNNQNNFNFATGTTQDVGDPNYPTGNSNLFFRNWHDFGPRLGFAWSPAFLPHTVFRAGYGVFYMEWQAQGDLGSAPKNALIYNFNAVPGDPAGLGFANLFPNADVAAAGTPYILAFQFHIPQPSIQEWNFTIQHQLKSNILLEASYVGNAGSHIWLFNEFNQPIPGPGSLVSRVPYPQVAYNSELVTPQGTSDYNALQLKVEKRFGSGLSFLSSYTRSKAIDLESDMIYRIYNRFNITQDHGLSDNDMPNRFVASWLYELPVGQGRHYLSGANRVVNQILGGWDVGGITLFESGIPFTVSALGDPANWGYGTRPNLVGPWQLSNPTINEWFNTAAFVKPAQYTLGNAGRNIVRGPGINDWDLNIEKSFRISESKQLQFRSEFYNAFNHASFNNPAATLGATNFGVISSATPGRIIQFALKFYF